MKAFAERHIRRSELFQLILLQHLYSRPESEHLVFQGGTAIRWCHGGERFSEDLDFVTHLDRPALENLMRSVETTVSRESIAHFGPGRLTVTTRGQRDEGAAWRSVFEPRTARDRITVKVECERLQGGSDPVDGTPRAGNAEGGLLPDRVGRIPHPPSQFGAGGRDSRGDSLRQGARVAGASLPRRVGISTMSGIFGTGCAFRSSAR